VKDVQFYEQFNDDEKTESAGKVIAVLVNRWKHGSAGQGRIFKAVLGLAKVPNAPAVQSTVAERYLDAKCRRISEARARQIHPNVFRILRQQGQ
jgi:hypothetical protein